jgi:hypothetical protein
MQLRLEFMEEKDGRRAKQLPRWERLAESARLEAAKRLAHLIARMLAAGRVGAVNDE